MPGRRNGLARALWPSVVCGLVAMVAAASAADLGKRTLAPLPVATWTATIPVAFPGNAYTLRLFADGRYEEDGRNIASGEPIQETLTGAWHAEGAKLVLRQDGPSYVYDGEAHGNFFFGVLFLNDRRISPFCARLGEVPPKTGGADEVVALPLAGPA